MSEKVIVSVNEGRIRGFKQVSKFSGKEFYSFLGVPYGKPPINALRFRDPVKANPWKDIFDATNEKDGCIHFSIWTLEFIGSEDCLFNNIHTPKLPQKGDAHLPVIVNIHPGSNNYGSPHTQLYGSPEFIMHHDVVYVCISYRLHILGFLNLKLKECSGNQGIKDIVLSLRWIKDNIQLLGGNPDNITLLGSSSGAVIIHTLMLSPSAQGLFHKAVLMGSYLTIPVTYRQESNEDYAREIALSLNYAGNLQDHRKLLSFLKKQNPLLLIEGSRRCQKDLQQTIAPIFPIGVFGPSLDQGEILPESPANLVESMARIPIIIGFSEVESIMGFVHTIIPATERNFKTSLRQNCFGWGYRLTDDDIRSIYKEVESFYLNEQPIEQAPQAIKMNIQTDLAISDIYDTIVNPISADLGSSVFVYKFEFEGNIFSINETLKNAVTEPVKGTFHGTDFSYWNRFSGCDPGDRETFQMVETFTKLITTFARKGDPNHEHCIVEWRPSTADNPCYLSINNPLEMVHGKLNNDRTEFWECIKKKYVQIRDAA